MLQDRTRKALIGINTATKKDGVKVKHLFKIMTSHSDIWWLAYAKLSKNKGAMTPGVDGKTLSGMSQERIDRLIRSLKDGSFKPRPVRRVYIPKKNGKRRPLGIPAADDKLVQEVVRIILEAIYEPVFSEHSHGFRPNRSCHSALIEMKQKWKAIKWVVDVDIKGFYDNINHAKLINVLEKKIDDRKFINVIRKFLKAGVMENWKFSNTFSGTPQGGICSPVLANIMLNEFDQFVETEIKQFNKGEKRRRNPVYDRLETRLYSHRKRYRMWEERGSFPFFLEEIKEKRIKPILEEKNRTPSQDFKDPNYKRCHYVRYADDFAFGIIGTKEEARRIKEKCTKFLKEELCLEVSEEKSGIHHIQDGLEYLGYYISLNHQNGIRKRAFRGMTEDGKKVMGTSRSTTAQLKFLVPKRKVWEFCRNKGYIMNDNKPISRPKLLQRSDYEIVASYNAEMRGFANYYNLASKKGLEILQWYGQTSLFKTLANKHRTKKWHIIRKMKTRNNEYFLEYAHKGKKRKLQVFQVKNRAEANLSKVDIIQPTFMYTRPTDILDRMHAKQCEYCKIKEGPFHIHHIKSLKDVKSKKKKKSWEYNMIQRNRKTMVLCTQCHKDLHSGKLASWKKDFYVKVESRVR